jgi:hypothetical protein
MENALALLFAALAENKPTDVSHALDVAAVEFRSTSGVKHIFQLGIFRKPSRDQILIRADAKLDTVRGTAKGNLSGTARVLKFPSHGGEAHLTPNRQKACQLTSKCSARGRLRVR